MFAAILLCSGSCLACDQVVRVSVAKNWPPYSYKEDGAYKGLDIEIVNLILTSVGLCWETYEYPSSSRAFAEFRKGNVDLLFAASETPDRRAYAAFSRPYRREDMLLFSHQRRAFPQKLVDQDLIAVNRGSFYGDAFAAFMKDCPECIVETNLSKERLGLVQMQRVDYAIEDSLAGAYLISSNGFSPVVKPTPMIINSNPVHLMLNEATLTPDQINKINQSILQNKAQITATVKHYIHLYGLEDIVELVNNY